MSRYTWIIIFGIVVLIAVHIVDAQAGSGFLYGTIVTDDDEELTGRIRWDKNEGAWDDILDADKVGDDRSHRSERRGERISIFGLDIYTDGSSWSSGSQSGVRFGYIEQINFRSRRNTTVVLKGGQKVSFSGGSDLISAREILIDDAKEGVTEVKPDAIKEVRFFPDDTAYVPSREFSGYHLYGTVETEPGIAFEGFIQWDVDEIWSTDILDGDQGSKSRKIPFGRIEKIEKLSSRASRVILFNGTDMRLSGSNDVNDENRGVVVMVPNWGRVIVNWDAFVAVTFKPAPEKVVRAYDGFKTPWRLRGTVSTEYGDKYTGEVTWDNDEEYSWEFLDGQYRDMDFDIEFGYIKSIEKHTSTSCEVTLFSGDKFRLRGSNDVNDENKGLVISTPDGGQTEVTWDDFQKVEFEPGK